MWSPVRASLAYRIASWDEPLSRANPIQQHHARIRRKPWASGISACRPRCARRRCPRVTHRIRVDQVRPLVRPVRPRRTAVARPVRGSRPRRARHVRQHGVAQEGIGERRRVGVAQYSQPDQCVDRGHRGRRSNPASAATLSRLTSAPSTPMAQVTSAVPGSERIRSNSPMAGSLSVVSRGRGNASTRYPRGGRRRRGETVALWRTRGSARETRSMRRTCRVRGNAVCGRPGRHRTPGG
jgi:hypothetical protein